MNLNRGSCIRCDRFIDHKYHHRDGYRIRNFAESSTSNRSSCDHNRSRDVRRSEELVPNPGISSRGRGFGNNSPGASFPIWSTV